MFGIEGIRELFALPLVIAIVSQVASQAFKVFYYSFRERRLAIDRFVHAGGMPSAHTAFVTALTAAIGIQSGITSDVFAVSTVFSFIVIYDAYRLRGHVQSHAVLLNRLLAPRRAVGEGASGDPDAPPVLREHVGHSLPEIGAGIIWGLMFAVGLS